MKKNHYIAKDLIPLPGVHISKEAAYCLIINSFLQRK